MALFLRGRMWWLEIKRPTVRIVKSTGFAKDDRAKAEAVYRAALFGLDVRPKKSVMEGMLAAIYGAVDKSLSVAVMWPLYEDWFRGKAKKVAENTMKMRRSRFDAFAKWASDNRVMNVHDVTVEVARRYVATLGGANKTQRIKVMDLSCVWNACAEMVPGIHNPWKAACPANDGSSERRDVFTDDEQRRILDAAKEVGSDWYGVCLTARWIGQRYGDVANLEWGTVEEAKRKKVLERGIVDLSAGLIVIDPSKTRRHGTRVFIPISEELLSFLKTMRHEHGTLLFPGHAAHHAQGQQMFPPFSAVLSKAGMSSENGYYDFHSWRHTFRSMLADAGVSDATANRFGGWTTAQMGGHYDHSTHIGEMSDAVSRIKKTAP